MDKFNAGYKLIEELSFSNKHYVLGHKPNAPAPYVTWEANESKAAFFRGHYFTDKEPALLDLFHRVGKDLHLEGGKTLGIALLTEQDHAMLQMQYLEASQRDSVCALLQDLLNSKDDCSYDYNALIADPDFMSEAISLYNAIDHSSENEAFTDNLENILDAFPQYKQEISPIPVFLQNPETTRLSPEEASLMNDLLKRPSAEIPDIYGPFGESFDFTYQLNNGFIAYLEILPTYDPMKPNQLSATEPPHVQARITNEQGQTVYQETFLARDLNHSLTGTHQLKDNNGHTFLTLSIQEDESLRRIDKQFVFDCSGGDEHYMKHNGELCTVKRGLTGKESDILINGLMWEAEFPDGDKLHVFDYELTMPAREVSQKLPLSQQIDSAQDKLNPDTANLSDPEPER